jgi:hypothetical protein
MSTTKPTRFVRINLSPRAGRLLGGVALVTMHGWFLLKLGLPSSSGFVELIVGLTAIMGMVTSIIFFVCTYGVLANAPDTLLDEREAADRNQAYFTAFKYIVLMTILGGLVPEFMAKLFRFELSVGVMINYMLLMFTTAIVLPGAVLAWKDRAGE